MSLQFNDTTNFKGMVQIYEKEIGLPRGTISGDSNRLKEFTADVNLVWDDYVHLAIHSSGRWQFDDSNYDTDISAIRTNIVSGTRIYPITEDDNGSLVLDIFKVAILPSSTATDYEELTPVDMQSDGLVGDFNSSTTGVPTEYDKTGNSIIFRTTPNYSATNGIIAYINREPSYFVSNDTTKKPGCPGNHHQYFPVKAAYMYARRNSLSSIGGLSSEVFRMEEMIKKDFSKRSRDEQDLLIPEPINYL